MLRLPVTLQVPPAGLFTKLSSPFAPADANGSPSSLAAGAALKLGPSKTAKIEIRAIETVTWSAEALAELLRRPFNRVGPVELLFGLGVDAVRGVRLRSNGFCSRANVLGKTKNGE